MPRLIKRIQDNLTLTAQSLAAGRFFLGALSAENLCGWAGPDVARDEVQRICGNMPSFSTMSPVNDTKGKRQMLWEFTRKALGKDTENFAQEIGDCFPAGTMVRMSNGSEKPIENVGIGDLIMTSASRPRRIIATICKNHTGELVTVQTKGQPRSVTATPDHRMRTVVSGVEGWTPIGELEIKDHLLLPFKVAVEEHIEFDMAIELGDSFNISENSITPGLASPIKEIDRFYVENVKVYCMEVEEDHSFIANGYAVHNCVSFGGKNALEHLQCVQMILSGKAEEFHPVFPPYFYGTSRINVGKGRLGYGDGSCGSWLQEAVKTYGVLRRDDQNVPQYSGSVAKTWGTRGVPDQFITTGKTHIVQTTAMITNVQDAAAALYSGYPIPICSNQGFTGMTPGSDGFHQPRGRWGHCMCLIGFEDHPQYGLYFIILNSWGDVHGHLKDFTSGVDMPVGILRVKAATIDDMLSGQDSFAFSQFNGFPDNSDNLNKALFDIVGD